MEVSEVTQSLRIFVLYVNSLQGDSPEVFETISGSPPDSELFSLIILRHYLQFLLIMFISISGDFLEAT